MNLLTSHSALSISTLREIEIDPAKFKRVSQIDRLGNLTPNNICLSPLLSRIAETLQSPEQPADCHLFSQLPRDIQWELSTEIRSLITQRKQLLVSLIPTAALGLIQQFFGKDTASRLTRRLPHIPCQPHSGKDEKPDIPVGDVDSLVQVIGSEVIPAEVASIASMQNQNSCVDLVSSEEMSQPHVPVAISPSAWCQSWCHGNDSRKTLVKMAFAGVDSSTISSKNYAALRECGANLIFTSRAYRAMHSPKFWAYAIVFIYSSLRALPVMFVKDFHGSVLLLWCMDVVTAIPYTWGLLAFVTGHKLWFRYLGLVVTLITFMAPYIYFWTHGKHYPMGINLIVVAMIVAAFLYEAHNFLRDKEVARGLRRTIV